MINSLFNKKFAYGLLGFLALVILTVGAIYYNPIVNPNPPLAKNTVVKDVGQNAFGKLQLALDQNNGGQEASKTSSDTSAPLALGRGGSDTSIAPMPPIYIENYKYVYKGDEFVIDKDQVIVYKKSIENTISNGLNRVLSGLDLGFINLGNFGNKKITSMEISENKDSGYSIYLDGRGNTVSIYMNWEKWPQDVYTTENVAQIVTPISEDKAISIANNFISEYGINLENYGKPEIQKPWYKGLIIQDLSVIYPLIINGQTVYDESGNKTGVYVQVSSRYNKVTNINGLELNSFESSKYDAEITEKEAIAIAEKGGMYGNYGYSEAAKTIEIQLGTPEIKLVKMWILPEGKQTSEELYIPSLIFPVLNEPDQTMYFYRNNIVVPLVGSLTQNGGGPIRIMGGAAGSAEGVAVPPTIVK